MIESAKLCIYCCRYGTKSARAWCFCCSSRKVMMSFNADPEQSTLFTLKMSIRRDFLVSMTSLVLNLSFAKQSSVSPSLTEISRWVLLCLTGAASALPLFSCPYNSRHSRWCGGAGRLLHPPSASDVAQRQRTVDAMSSSRCHWSWSEKRQRVCMRPTELKPNSVRQTPSITAPAGSKS